MCAVYSVYCVACSAHCPVCGMESVVCSVQNTVRRVHCVVCRVQCAVCSQNSFYFVILGSLWYSPFRVKCKLFDLVGVKRDDGNAIVNT